MKRPCGVRFDAMRSGFPTRTDAALVALSSAAINCVGRMEEEYCHRVVYLTVVCKFKEKSYVLVAVNFFWGVGQQ